MFFDANNNTVVKPSLRLLAGEISNFQLRIAASAGRYLKCRTGGDYTVEARLAGSGNAFTNLYTGSINLDPAALNLPEQETGNPYFSALFLEQLHHPLFDIRITALTGATGTATLSLEISNNAV